MTELPYVIVPKIPTEEMKIAGLTGRMPGIGDPPLYHIIWQDMIAASACPVSLDEIVEVLEEWAQRIDVDGTPSQIVSADEVRSLLHRLKAQTPGKE